MYIEKDHKFICDICNATIDEPTHSVQLFLGSPIKLDEEQFETAMYRQPFEDTDNPQTYLVCDKCKFRYKAEFDDYVRDLNLVFSSFDQDLRNTTMQLVNRIRRDPD